MYHKEQALEQIECTRNEFESILKKLGMTGKKEFSPADIRQVQGKVEQKRKREKLYIYIVILIAIILVAIVFVSFNIAVGKLAG